MIELLRKIYFPENILDMLNNSIGIFDGWLIIHVLSGIGIGLILSLSKKRIHWGYILGVILAFESFENIYLAMNGLSAPESIINILLDILFTFGGYLLFKRWLKK